MKIDFHRNFDKRFKKLNTRQRQQFKIKLTIFTQDQSHPTLNNHGLKGRYAGYRSINISGDFRAVFIQHSASHVEFIDIGSHSQLYG